MSGTTATASVPARVNLAGNPSDGYGGAVLSATVDSLAATVSIEPGDERVIGHADAEPLITAALASLDDLLDAGPRRPGTYTWTTTIPRSVGLGGSSAIVLATMLAALDWWEIENRPDELALAHAALSAEVDRLGIAAGLADRAVQAIGGVVLTDCRTEPPSASSIRPGGTIPMTLLWNDAAAAPSDAYHRHLRRRHQTGDRAMAAAVARLSAWADDAAAAVRDHDGSRLAVAMTASLEERRALGQVPPAALEGVDGILDTGAAVNFAGSGGALVVLGPCDTPPGWRQREFEVGPSSRAPGPSPGSRAGP